ncbi:MAG: PAS domain S-box protein [Mariprofundaceae bacterium]
MNKREIGNIFIGILSLLVVVALYFQQKESVNTSLDTGVLHTITKLKHQNVLLNEDLLLSRSSQLHNFDRIVSITQEINDLMDSLSTYQHVLNNTQRSRFNTLLKRLSTIIDKKQALIETYKGEFAIYLNSLRYLPKAAQNIQPTLTAKQRTLLYDLTSDIYIYISNPSPQLDEHIQNMMYRMENTSFSGKSDTDIKNIVKHSRLLIKKSRMTSKFSNTITALNPTNTLDEVIEVFRSQQVANIKKTGNFRLLLLLFSCLLLIYILFSMRRARQSTLDLETTAQELKYQKLALDQHSIVAVTDPLGNIIYANEKFCDISQYTEEELLGQNHRILNSSQHNHDFFKHMWKKIMHGEIWQGEIKNKKKDGSFYWVDTTIIPSLNKTGEVERYISIRTDITARKEAEFRIHESEKRLQLVLDTALDAVIITNIDGCLTYMNPQAEQLYGWNREELAGMPLLDKIIPAKHMKMFRGSNQASSVLDQRFEIYSHRRDGSEFPAEISISMLRQDQGIHFSTFIRDISARKDAEIELKEAHDQALESSKLKSEFLSTVSHEVRTPMNGIIGMSDLLLDTDLDRDQREFSETIKDSANSLLVIINDLLDFSKAEAGKMEIEAINFSLEAIVEGSVETLAGRCSGSPVSLMSNIDPQLPDTLVGDPGRLRQILLNLIGNAIKFTHEGQVSVHANLVSRSEKSVSICFEVEDSGIGMSRDALRKIFQPFTQADGSVTRKYGGTGLGLSICTQLIDLMGGEIQVESSEKTGSTFRFTLSFPIVHQSTTETIEVGKQASLHILITEKNIKASKILSRYLQSWNFKSEIVEPGGSTVALMQKRASESQAFDLVLLDCNDSDNETIKTIEHISSLPEIANSKLLLIAPTNAKELRNQAASLGFSSYLNKPIRKSALFDQIMGSMYANDTNTKDALKQQGTAHVPHNTDQTRLLLAEDNVVNQRVASLLLKKQGYIVEIATNGQEVVEKSKQKEFAAILMDCQMPILDGLEATKMIRQREKDEETPRITIIAMTANAMEGDRERCLEAGMDDYVSKPISVEKLAPMLAKWAPHFEGSERVGTTNKVNPDLADMDKSYLLDLFDGDEEAVQECLTTFLASTPTILEKTYQAMAENDHQHVQALGHELKGVCANIGAEMLADIAAQCEKAGKSQESTTYATLKAALRSSFAALEVQRI